MIIDVYVGNNQIHATWEMQLKNSMNDITQANSVIVGLKSSRNNLLWLLSSLVYSLQKTDWDDLEQHNQEAYQEQHHQHGPMDDLK